MSKLLCCKVRHARNERRFAVVICAWLMALGAACRAVLFFVFIVFLFHVESSAAQTSVGPCSSTDALHWVVDSNCTIDVVNEGIKHVDLLTLNGLRAGELPTAFLSGPGPFTGVGAASLRNVILSSSNVVQNPISIEELLCPPLVTRGTPVNLTNVQIVYAVPKARQSVAVAALRGVVSDLLVQQAIETWNLNLYTDYVSFVYVNSYSQAGFSCSGCGIFLQFEDASGPSSTADGTGLGINYMLLVNNETFTQSLLKYATVNTVRPLFLLLASNVTWGHHPLMNETSSLQVRRPLVIAGQQGIKTSIDLGMQANKVSLSAPYANVSFDGVILENLVYGDKQSGNQLSGLSLVNTFNFWFFYWARQDVRLVMNNVTNVAASQREVEYVSYWNVMFSSTDPELKEQAQWMKSGPGITVWESVVTTTGLLDLKFVSRAQIAKDTWRTAIPQVAPVLEMQLEDPSLYLTSLNTHAAAPLAALARTDESLQEFFGALSGLHRDGLAAVIAPVLSLGPDPANGWPPAAGITLKGTQITIVGYSVCSVLNQTTSNSSSSSSGNSGNSSSILVADEGTASGSSTVWQGPLPQLQMVANVTGSSVDAVLLDCHAGAKDHHHPGHTDDDSHTLIAAKAATQRLLHSAMLDMGQLQNVLLLKPHGTSSKLALHALTLFGLAQGPAVTAAAAVQGQSGSSSGSSGRRLLSWAWVPGQFPHVQGSSSSSWHQRRLLHTRVVSSSSGSSIPGAAVGVQEQVIVAADGSGGSYTLDLQQQQQQQLVVSEEALSCTGKTAAAATADVVMQADGSGGGRVVKAETMYGVRAVATSAGCSGKHSRHSQAPAAAAPGAAAAAGKSGAVSPAPKQRINQESFWVLQRQRPTAQHATAAAAAAAAAAASSGGLNAGGRRLQQISQLTQQSPDVWTHLLWAINRSAGGNSSGGEVFLSDVQLLLPPPEFAKLLTASRSSPNGSFSLPLTGPNGARMSLTANLSTFVEDCCLLIQNYSAPGMTAQNLLLLSDPDTARAMPPGYFWPYDGTEADLRGLTAAISQQRSREDRSSLKPGAIAGIIIGIVAGCLLLAALLLVFVVRHRRRRQHLAGAAADGKHGLSKCTAWLGISNAAGSDHADSADTGAAITSSASAGATAHKKGVGSMNDSSDVHGVREVQVLQHSSGSASGTTSCCEQRQPASHRVGSSAGDHGQAAPTATATGVAAGVLSDKRWLRLTSAISGKVQDIHQNRLKSALLQSQVVAVAAERSSAPADSIAGQQAGSSSGSSQAAAAAADGAAVASCDKSGSIAGPAAPAAPAAPASSNAPAAVPSNVLQLKEVIGQGSFGVVYRASWQGVNVAVKLLQLPPGTRAPQAMGGTHTWGHSTYTVGSMSAEGANPSSKAARLGGLLKQEHMAVQEAAIGSTMVHPNIVAVYSIALRPSTASAASAPPGFRQPGSGSSCGVLLLDQGTTVGADGSPQLAAQPDEAAELLPWEMQLVMEYCDQGTLRQALDASLLVNKATGCHHLPTVLSLAHNVACAMQYLHQEHIIHGDLKASNVLLKTSIPAMIASSSEHSSVSRSNSADAAAAVPALNNNSSVSSLQRQQQQGGSTQLPDATPAAGSSGQLFSHNMQAIGGDAAAAAASRSVSTGGQSASNAIMSAAAAAAGETNSGIHTLIKGGWVIAKVSDFGLSLCVDPGETHVSSVHAGTLTHMAPELLMHGHCSKASDVFSYGILLWELATGGKAFAGIPKPLLGHCIVSQQMRPCWPPHMRNNPAWAGLVSVAEQCWAQHPHSRPTFTDVVQVLDKLLKQNPTNAASLGPGSQASAASGSSSSQQQRAVVQGSNPAQNIEFCSPGALAAQLAVHPGHPGGRPSPSDALLAMLSPQNVTWMNQQANLASLHGQGGPLGVKQWLQGLTQSHQSSTNSWGSDQPGMTIVPSSPCQGGNDQKQPWLDDTPRQQLLASLSPLPQQQQQEQQAQHGAAPLVQQLQQLLLQDAEKRQQFQPPAQDLLEKILNLRNEPAAAQVGNAQPPQQQQQQQQPDLDWKPTSKPCLPSQPEELLELELQDVTPPPWCQLELQQQQQ